MKRNRLSFFSLLVRNYIALTIIIIISVLGILKLTEHKIKNIISEPRIDELVDFASLIEENKNNDIDEREIKKLTGKDTYIQILNEKNEIIYESDPKKGSDKFTDKELECIQNYYDDYYIDIQKHTTDKNKENTSVYIAYYDDNNNNFHNKIYMIDKDLNLIYTNTNDDRKYFTEKEFKYLTGTYINGYDISKYEFKDKKNRNLKLLIYTPSINNELIKRIDYVEIISIIEFVIIYIALIILLILWLNRKVKKPLDILNNAIVKLKNGERENYLQYEGPQEFVEICDSFNDMSKQIYISEQKRQNLEKEKQKILADISHDLKTPITVIKGYSKAICDNMVSKDDMSQYLKAINKKADELNEMINTFHEYSKVQHPDYKYIFEKSDICEYVRAYLAQKYDELYISGVDIEADIPEDIIYCEIDKFQLKRVFENIVSNALKHNEKDISILFKVEKVLDKVKINIADNGDGIPMNMEEEIFSPFVMGEKSRTKKGSGLGLSISKKIVEAHGGTIKIVKASEDYKTEFEIILPLKKQLH